VIGYLLARAKLVEGRQVGRRRMPDLLGAVLLAAATAALVLAVVRGSDWGWLSVRTVGTGGAAFALLGLFGWRCRVHPAPLVDLALLRRRAFVVANAASVAAAAGFFGYTLVNVLFLTEVWRYSVLDAGLAITPGPLVAIAVARPFGRLAERIGHRIVLVGGGLWWGAAVLWFTERVGPQPDYVAQWLPGMVLLGIGAGALFPGLSAVAVASAPGDGFASATGLNTVARQVGAAIGVAAVVAIVQSADPTQPADVLHAFDHAWTFAAACLVAAGIGCVLVGRRALASEDRARPVAPELSSAPKPQARQSRPAAPSGGPVHSARPADRLVGTAPGLGQVRSGSRLAAPTTTTLDDVTVHLGRLGAIDIDAAVELLGRTPLFAVLDEGVQRTVAERSGTVRLAAGAWLYRRGDPAEALYVVRSGRLQVVDEASGRVTADLGRGDVVGAVALLNGGARAASVRATRTTELLAVPAMTVERLLVGRLEMALVLSRMLAERLSKGGPSNVRPVPSTIALVPLDPAVPVVAIAHHLTAELRRWGRADMLLPLNEAGFAPLLDRALAGNDQLVMPAVPGTPWADFSLAHADRILVVGSAAAGQVRPHPSELHGCDLVTWDVAPGSGALAGWAAELDPVETHALRNASVGPDMARMARRLAGRSLGIVLSGGGARAFAHLGVLEELQAAGVVVDRVGGTSMGAFIGAMYAMGLSPAEIDARCYDEWVRGKPLRDVTVPRHALIRGDRCRAMLRRTFGDVAIEELPRGLYTTATDLRRGELVVTRSGRLADAVGASIALPVLAPALLRSRQILVDGSLTDNLPVAAMAALGEGPIIAVDCKASVGRPSAGGPRALGMGSTLGHVLTLAAANTSQSARMHADLTVTPHDPGIGLLEFWQIDAAKEAGRAAVRRALDGAAVPVVA
jgi:predicted acylesterase/phospholipase RssA